MEYRVSKSSIGVSSSRGYAGNDSVSRNDY